MSLRITKYFYYCVLAIFLATKTPHAAEFDELTRLIPRDVNTVVVLDVKSILSSQLAMSERWAEKYEDKFETAPLKVPPKATKFIMGAELDLAHMHPISEVAAMELGTDRSIPEIAVKSQGVTDQLAGLDAVWTRRFGCIVKFAPRTFALMMPAGRQETARWVRNVQRSSGSPLSPYLQEAVNFVEKNGTEIVMAIDFEDALRETEIKKAVASSQLVPRESKAAVAKTLASVRGITLGVRVDSRAYGRLKIDFKEDATPLQGIVKPLILQILSRGGAVLDEFESWKPKVNEKEISIAGRLTQEGIRRLFSVLTIDAAIPDEPPDPEPQSTDSNLAAKGKASLRYFKAVNRYLDSLQSPRGKKSYDKITLWLKNYAKKIDRLPRYNVDPEMVAYGEFVSDTMRSAIAVVHGIDQRTAEQIAQIRSKAKVKVGALPTGNVNNYGGYRVREYAPFYSAQVDVASALRERDSITEKELERGKSEAENLMNQIRYQRTDIAEMMKKKYSLEF